MNARAAPVIEIEGLAQRRGQGAGAYTVTVDRLALEPGEAVALIGESGSGKSTLVDVLALLAAPGAVRRFVLAAGGERHDVAAAWRNGGGGLAAVRGRLMGVVLQTGGLLPYLSVAENIRLPAQLAGTLDAAVIGGLAETLDIADRMDLMPAALSIGERQRVAIARALSHRPALLPADEPTAALDPARAAEVMALLHGAARRLGTAVLVVSHDLGPVAGLGFRRLHLAVDRSASGRTGSRLEEAA